MTGRTATVIAVISALAIVGVLALYAALRSEPPAASPSTTPPSPTATVATATVTPTATATAVTPELLRGITESFRFAGS